MGDNKRVFSAREAAQAVLKKVHETLAKSEILQKYEAENKTAPSKPKNPDGKDLERDFKDFEVKAGKSAENDKRVAKQVSPSKNPKEEAEGNNPKPGAMPKNLGKAENPDEKADAQLGEKVEHDVEEHMKENAGAESKEGHEMPQPDNKSEDTQNQQAFVPARLIGSAKLSKFMERKHAKRKAGAAPTHMEDKSGKTE